MPPSDLEIAHAPTPISRGIRLRRVDDAQQRLAQRLGAGLQAELQLDAATTLRIEASGLRAATGAQVHGPLLQHTPAGTLALSPAREILRLLTAIDVAGSAGEDPLHRLRLDMAAHAMPEGWWALFGTSATLVASDEVPGPFEVTLALFQPQARLGMSAIVRGSSEALLHALLQPGWRRLDDEGLASPSHEDVPHRVPVCIGTTELPLPALESLAPGDVLRVSRPCFDLLGQGELQIARGWAKCALHLGNHARLEITEWRPSTAPDSTMNHTTDHATGLGSPAHDEVLDEVAVTLSFEIGALDLPLSQLRQLAPGSVLPIVGGTPPQVAICAGSRRIGIGELVELAGGLAVEIRRIGARS